VDAAVALVDLVAAGALVTTGRDDTDVVSAGAFVDGAGAAAGADVRTYVTVLDGAAGAWWTFARARDG
jgi:hypothetical protein